MRLDSPVLAAGTRITNLLILNFYWLLGCLPIVTAGASTIAAFSVTLKMAEDREGSSMTAQFWTAFVKNLKHGVPLSLILLAGLGSVWMDVKLIEEQIGNCGPDSASDALSLCLCLGSPLQKRPSGGIVQRTRNFPL